jgi:hypothetical protein
MFLSITNALAILFYFILFYFFNLQNKYAPDGTTVGPMDQMGGVVDRG